MKKLLLIFLCGIVSLALIGCVGDETKPEKAEFTWTMDDNGTLTISGTGEMVDYSYSDDFRPPWENEKELIEAIKIDNGITSIGDYAFYGYDSLESITIPDSATSIGEDAFFSCDSLESITIPDSVTSIGDEAFSYCDSLESITIPDSVTSIGDFAFFGWTSSQHIYIKGSTAGWDAYWNKACEANVVFG